MSRNIALATRVRIPAGGKSILATLAAARRRVTSRLFCRSGWL
jgi:hypothetical protein